MFSKPRAAVLLTAFAPPAMPAPIWLPAAPIPIFMFVKPFVDMTFLTHLTTTILMICVEINQCVEYTRQFFTKSFFRGWRGRPGSVER